MNACGGMSAVAAGSEEGPFVCGDAGGGGATSRIQPPKWWSWAVGPRFGAARAGQGERGERQLASWAKAQVGLPIARRLGSAQLAPAHFLLVRPSSQIITSLARATIQDGELYQARLGRQLGQSACSLMSRG